MEKLKDGKLMWFIVVVGMFLSVVVSVNTTLGDPTIGVTEKQIPQQIDTIIIGGVSYGIIKDTTSINEIVYYATEEGKQITGPYVNNRNWKKRINRTPILRENLMIRQIKTITVGGVSYGIIKDNKTTDEISYYGMKEGKRVTKFYLTDKDWDRRLEKQLVFARAPDVMLTLPLVTSTSAETLEISFSTDIGRPTLIETILKQAKSWFGTYYVDGSQKTQTTTGITISVTGNNVASQASVSYYIEGVANDASGNPYRFLEGNDTSVTVGGASLTPTDQITIVEHLTAMGLSTETGHTIDYYVYVKADATGTISGDTLTSEISKTLFDTVSYGYAGLLSNAFFDDPTVDGYIRRADLPRVEDSIYIGGDYCLTGDSQITMGDGSFKRIDQIVVGDVVAYFDWGTRTIQNTLVTKTKLHPAEEVSGYYFIINGELKITPEHIVYKSDGSQVAVSELNVGDHLQGADGRPRLITSIEWISNELTDYGIWTSLRYHLDSLVSRVTGASHEVPTVEPLYNIWTESVDYIAEGYAIVDGKTVYCWHTYIEWDISELAPSSTIIHSVFFLYHGYSSTSAQGLAIHQMELQPTVATTQDVFDDIINGTQYYGPTKIQEGSNKQIGLGTYARDDLADHLSLGWFALGFEPSWSGHPDYSSYEEILFSEEYSGASPPPTLLVKYYPLSASWNQLPPLSVVSMPLAQDVAAVLAVIITSFVIIQKERS